MIFLNEIIKLSKKYSYRNLINDIEYLKYSYKDFHTGIVGESTIGRKIFFIRLGSGKEKLLIKFSEKANESVLSSVCMSFVEELLISIHKNEFYKCYDVKELLENYTIFFIPMVNPDGVGLVLREKEILLNRSYQHIWKKYYSVLELWKNNIRGVDIENNYRKSWDENALKLLKQGKNKPNSNSYPGLNYLSEKENISIEKFIDIHRIKTILTIKLEGKRKYIMNTKTIKFLVEEKIFESLNVEFCRNLTNDFC